MKSKRQNEIIRLISATDIETQEELASELRNLGYKVTQATVSRDIRELRLVKSAAKGREPECCENTERIGQCRCGSA